MCLSGNGVDSVSPLDIVRGALSFPLDGDFQSVRVAVARPRAHLCERSALRPALHELGNIVLLLLCERLLGGGVDSGAPGSVALPLDARDEV